MRKLLRWPRCSRYFLLVIACLAIAGVSGWASGESGAKLWDANKSVEVITGDSYSNSNAPIFLSRERRCDERRILQQKVCTVSTAGYILTDDARVIIAGNDKLPPIKNGLYSNTRLIPLSGSGKMIEVVGKENAARLRIIGNAYSNTQQIIKDKVVNTVIITSTSQHDLLDNLNNSYLLSSYYLNVSADNRWIVSQNGNGIYKYNLETEEIQYIRTGLYTSSGYSPKLMLAISDSGRYVAVYSGGQNLLEVIDTESCSNRAAKRGQDTVCSVQQVMPEVRSSVKNLSLEVQFKHLQFESDSMLSFYVYTDWVNNNNHSVKKVYATSTYNTNQRKINYLALGDSFAAGEGLYKYKSETSRFGINMCHLSLQSYPYQLANRGITGDMESVACSGARIKDIINIEKREYVDNKPQSKEFVNDKYRDHVLSSFLVGNRRQFEFAEIYQPNIITISISGNDIGFSSIIRKCVLGPSACYQSKQQRQELASLVRNTFPQLVDTYNKLKIASPKSTIYVIGYPQIVKESGNCASNVLLSNDEIRFANKLTTYLNYVIKKAAQEAGVIYVDTEQAFYGRRLCETVSSLAAANGLSAGNASILPRTPTEIIGAGGPIGQESYHPTLIGHAMYANAIQQKTNNFTLTMPNPIAQDISAPSTELSDFINDAPDGINYATNATYIYEDSMFDDAIARGATKTVSLSTLQYGTTPNTNFSLVMYSEPTQLGTITSDENGDVSADITIPSGIEPGYHTLHLIGTNMGGETIDIQKIVYVAASEEDFDGDGILNEDEACLVSEPAGVDVDKDNIDDGCDGFVDETPPVVVEPEQPPVETPEGPDTEQPPTEQPQEPLDKEILPSESRPDWLIMKENEMAEEQAAANQSAMVLATSQEPANTLALSSQTSQSATQDSQDDEQGTATVDTAANSAPKTAVAGVSSAVESKPTEQKSTPWLAYGIGAVVLTTLSLGAYRILARETEYN